MASPGPKVKICGITRPQDAGLAAAAGADAIGLNFVAGPRKITPAAAMAIIDALPEQVDTWALVDVRQGDVPPDLRDLVADQRITHAQAYGQLLPATLSRLSDYGLKTVAVRHVTGPEFVDQTKDWLDQCAPRRPDLLLLDAGGVKQLGGTGRTLNWSMIAEQRDAHRLNDWPPIVLAGGLTPYNVAQAADIVRPQWVDLSSGVETAPGIKDADKMMALIEAVRS